jgi:hypothetical protein
VGFGARTRKRRAPRADGDFPELTAILAHGRQFCRFAARLDSRRPLLHLSAQMLWRLRAFPDFVEPCLPSQVERPSFRTSPHRGLRSAVTVTALESTPWGSGERLLEPDASN